MLSAAQAKQTGLRGRPRELLKQGVAAAAGLLQHAIMLEGIQKQPGGLGMRLRISLTVSTPSAADAAIKSFQVKPHMLIRRQASVLHLMQNTIFKLLKRCYRIFRVKFTELPGFGPRLAKMHVAHSISACTNTNLNAVAVKLAGSNFSI